MSDLLTTVGTIASLPQETPTPNYQVRLSEVLCICDSLLMAGEVAATSIQIIADERLQLAKHTADTDASVAREEVEVQRLRKLLERERRVVDHRKQLDALANIILQYPTRAQFSHRFERAGLAAANVDRHIDGLQHVRDGLSKELSLLLACAAGVQTSANQMQLLLEEQPTNPADLVVADVAETNGSVPAPPPTTAVSTSGDAAADASADAAADAAADTDGQASGTAADMATGTAGENGVDRMDVS